jgi:hypothetical protein
VSNPFDRFAIEPEWGRPRSGRPGCWGRFELAANRFQHAVEIIENIVIPKPDDTIAMKYQFGAASVVRVHSLGMLTAIEFDDELARGASEIRNTASDRMLPAKLPGDDALAQRSPEDLFDIRSLSAQAPCDLCSCSQPHCQPHLTRPLRPNGAERRR